MDDEKQATSGSPCHHMTMVLEDIYESMPTGRKAIGQIALCTAPVRRDGATDLCYKPCREVVAFRGVKGLQAAWPDMLRAHPRPPYYFVRDAAGNLRPESGALPATAQPQELAWVSGYEAAAGE